MIRALSFMFAASLLAACGSSPTVRLHTLMKPAPAARAVAHAGYAIAVQVAAVPAQVDVPQLVLRQGATGLALAETEQWSAPLGEELRAALAAELTQRLGVPEVSQLKAAAQLPVWRIRVDVRRFDSTLARSAGIEAQWTLQPPGERALLLCASRVEVPVADGYPALVGGHQKAVAQIAAEIAAELNAQRNAGSPQPSRRGCPV